MNSTRQSLQILSNVQPEDGKSMQTTPKLPKRERLNSISRLLKNKNLSELSDKRSDGRKQPRKLMTSMRPSVDIRILPCSPKSGESEDLKANTLLMCDQGYLTPSRLPFSPSLLHKVSPTSISPSYRRPSPLRSPLYSPDRQSIYLGRGSFGKVTLCKFRGMEFAVKVIQGELLSSTGEQNLLGIRHPHLVQIFHISSGPEGTLVFMEFAGHCNLQQILNTKSQLDLRRKLSFSIQIASGLLHCHRNKIVHGDVKPANVMVSPTGICRLGDFGNSSRVDCGSDGAFFPTPSKDIVGTAAYAAPEVLKGSRPAQTSDVYSFGILLWQVHTREMPFTGEHPHVVIYKVVHYGTRPKFREDMNPIVSRFAKVAEDCWRAIPSQRLDMSRALSSLQAIMNIIKESN